MARRGILIDEVAFNEKSVNDEHTLYGKAEDSLVYITTTDYHGIKQHDFCMKPEEWELFKKIIDLNLAKEEGNG